MQYRKFEELPQYFIDKGISTPFKAGMSEKEILQVINEIGLADEMIDLTGMKLDDQNVGHNAVYQTLLCDGDVKIRVVFEATYEEYDVEYDTWQYIYTYPVGWQVV